MLQSWRVEQARPLQRDGEEGETDRDPLGGGETASQGPGLWGGRHRARGGSHGQEDVGHGREEHADGAGGALLGAGEDPIALFPTKCLSRLYRLNQVSQMLQIKILNGYENIDRNILFSVKEERRTRGHGVTLAKKQCRLDIRKFSFSQRTINEWNRLSADCVGASSVNMFKKKLTCT